MLGFLGMLMVAAVGMSAMTGMTSDTDEIDSDLPDDDPNSDSGSDITLTGFDTLSGTDGDDRITIYTDQHADRDFTNYWGEGNIHLDIIDDAPIAQIDAGAGDDTIVAKGGHAIIYTGEGTDTVDARNLEYGVIYAGEGDIVRGSDAGQDVGVLIEGAGTYFAGTGGGNAVAVGDGATLNGGAGRDFLFSEDGGATLIGGDGDDRIDANALWNEYGGHWDQTGGPDDNIDIIDAGAGDDFVDDVANGDIVTLGEGEDFATAIYDHALSEMDPVTFTDMNAAEDTVYLRVLGIPDPDGAVATYFTDYGDPVVTLDGRFEILEGDGDSHVFVDDELVAVFENTTGLMAETYVVEDRYGDFKYQGLKFAAA